MSTLTAEQLEQRKYIVEEMIANAELSNQKVSDETKSKLFDYANGDISREELNMYLAGN